MSEYDTFWNIMKGLELESAKRRELELAYKGFTPESYVAYCQELCEDTLIAPDGTIFSKKDGTILYKGD